jgi:hypothetical protein
MPAGNRRSASYQPLKEILRMNDICTIDLDQ